MGPTEDEIVGWNHLLSGHEFEQIPRDSEGQGISDAIQLSHPLLSPSPALNLSQHQGLFK